MLNSMVNILINYGVLGIIITAAAEPLFLLFPLELIYIPVSLLNPKNAPYYTLALIFSSTIGVIIGYVVGQSVGQKVLHKIISEDKINLVRNKYNNNVLTTMIWSMFVPIPYNVFILTAGAFKINFLKFVLASIIATSVRYIPQGILIWQYGDKLLWIFRDYFWVVGVIIILSIIAFGRREKKAIGKHIKIRKYRGDYHKK